LKKKRINVLFLLPKLKPGGSETLVLNIVKGMDRKRFVPNIAWFHEEKAGPFCDLDKVPMIFLDKRAGFDFLLIFKILKIIKDKRIDIVNAHHFMPLFYSFFACKLSLCTKLIYTEHSVWELEERIIGYWKQIARVIFRRVDAIVGVSPEIAGYFVDAYSIDERQVYSIINGVDINRFKPAGGRVRSSGSKSGTITIGMIGNFKHVKNHALLINAFKDLVASFPNCRLWLIGQGFPNEPDNSEDVIAHMVDQYALADKVQFMGYREDVDDLLKAMDIFCLPSHQEGLPMSIIEAMATGLPVIGTDVPGIRIVVKSNRNGFLVASNNQAELTRALIQLVSDAGLRKKMGEAGRADVEKYYSLKKCIEEYSALFESLIDQR